MVSPNLPGNINLSKFISIMTDPIADFLTRIRNAASARQKEVRAPYSIIKHKIADILVKEKVILSAKKESVEGHNYLVLSLTPNRALTLTRVSKPGQRIYVGYEGVNKVRNGFGISIISTSRGLMTGKEAKYHRVGGEYICEVY